MRRSAQRAHDEGFTLVEVVVSLAVAAMLLGAITTFAVGGMGASRQQGREQTAVQLALDGMELARTLRGAAIIEGRAACTSAGCPSATATGAEPYLQGTQRYDVPATPAVPPTLPLPATGEEHVVDTVPFRRYWYVGRCWAPAGGGACVDTPSHAPTAARPVPFYRVVVAVTWPQQACGAAGCHYVSSALFGASPLDPVFRT